MNKYDVAAIAAINGLDNNEIHKLTAAQQREMFGFVVVGRKDISFDPRDQGTVRVGKWTDGTNYSSWPFTYEEFAQAINERKPLEAW